MQLQKEGILSRFQQLLSSIGVACDALEPGSIEIDKEFEQKVRGNRGIINVGSIRILSKSIDYANLLKRLEYHAGSESYGTYFTSAHVVDLWQVRYFLRTDREGNLAPLDLFTDSRMEKGLMHSRVVDVAWKGRGRMTTLPAHIQNDDLLPQLNGDKELRTMLLQNLGKEKTVRVRAYTPKKTDDAEWRDYVVIFGEWRENSGIFIGKECFDMYDRIAYIVKEMIRSLRYW